MAPKDVNPVRRFYYITLFILYTPSPTIKPLNNNNAKKNNNNSIVHNRSITMLYNTQATIIYGKWWEMCVLWENIKFLVGKFNIFIPLCMCVRACEAKIVQMGQNWRCCKVFSREFRCLDFALLCKIVQNVHCFEKPSFAVSDRKICKNIQIYLEILKRVRTFASQSNGKRLYRR